MPAKCERCGERHTVCFGPCNRKPRKGKAEAVLTLRVLYDLNGTSREDLTRLLRGLVVRAAGEGLMTGNTPALVEEYDESVRWTDER